MHLMQWSFLAATLTYPLLNASANTTVNKLESNACMAVRALPFTDNAYDPQTHLSTIDGIVYRELMDTLLRVEPNGTLAPAIAKSFVVDGKTGSIQFNIDPSCSWSDGMPIVPEDFILSFQRILIGENTNRDPQLLKVVGAQAIVDGNADAKTLKVIKESEHSFRAYLKTSPTEFLNSLGSSNFAPMPSHLMNYSQPYTPLKISSGPFAVHNVTDTEMVFKKNPHYCDLKHSNIDMIKLLNIKDKFEEYSLLSAGKLDVMLFPPEQQLAQVRSAGKEGKSNLSAIDKPLNRQVYLMINPISIPDENIRLAISLVIDRDEMAKRGNLNTPSRILSQSLIHRTGGYKGLPYEQLVYQNLTISERIQKAKQIMEAQGYNDKNKLNLEITTYPLELYRSTAKFAAGMLSQAHFNVQYKELASVNAAVKHQSALDSQLFILSWDLDYPDPLNSFHGMMGAAGLSEKFSKYYQLNTELENVFQNIESNLRGARSTYDSDQRDQFLKKAEKILLEQHVYVPLFNPVGSYLVSNDLQKKQPNIYLRLADYDKISCVE